MAVREAGNAGGLVVSLFELTCRALGKAKIVCCKIHNTQMVFKPPI